MKSKWGKVGVVGVWVVALEVAAASAIAAVATVPVHGTDTVEDTCFGQNAGTKCTFSNVGPRPASFCIRGIVGSKRDQKAKLETMPLCVTLDPMTTETISGPWKRGLAEDYCSSEGSFGTQTLDWDQCFFTTEPVDP